MTGTATTAADNEQVLAPGGIIGKSSPLSGQEIGDTRIISLQALNLTFGLAIVSSLENPDELDWMFFGTNIQMSYPTY